MVRGEQPIGKLVRSVRGLGAAAGLVRDGSLGEGVVSDGAVWIDETSTLVDSRSGRAETITRSFRRRYDRAGLLDLACLESKGQQVAFVRSPKQTTLCGPGGWRSVPLASEETLRDALWEREAVKTAAPPARIEFEPDCACDRRYQIREAFRGASANAVPSAKRYRLTTEDGLQVTATLDSTGLERVAVGGVEFVRGDRTVGVGVRPGDLSLAIDQQQAQACKRGLACAFLLGGEVQVPSTPFQRVLSFPAGKLVVVTATATAREPYLAESGPGFSITSMKLTNPAGSAIVEQLKAEASGDARIALAIALLHQVLEVRDAASLDDADAVFAAGGGDCTEFALALAAVLSATDLPAEVVGGYVVAGSPLELVPHAWVEVTVDGHRQRIDAVWPQRVADSTHLEIRRGILASAQVIGAWTPATDDRHGHAQ